MQKFLRFVDQGILLLFLLLSDIFWFFLSFLLAYTIRNNILPVFIGRAPIQPLTVYLSVIPYILILMVVIFYWYGLYERRTRQTGLSEIVRLTRAVTFCLLLIMAASFLQKYEYSRGLVIIFYVCSLVLINVGRLIVRTVQRYFVAVGKGEIRILIIGAGKPGRKLAEQLNAYKDFGYYIVGFLDDHAKPRNDGYKFFGSTKNLSKILRTHSVDEVFIADPSMAHEEVLNLIHDCEHVDVRFKIASGLFEIVTGEIDLQDIESIPAIDLRHSANRLDYRIIKRIFDFCVATVSAIILAPVFLLVAIAIRMDSKGAALFVHDRVGKNGKIFRMYKFRTMRMDTPAAAEAPRHSKDSRITRVGKFLRKTSLDELPQLWNVITGEMSLVGPRPEMPFLVEKYNRWQRRRLDVKPGITGLWQILGRKDLPLSENLEYDFYYMKNASFLLDIVILLKTAWIVLSGKGAY